MTSGPVPADLDGCRTALHPEAAIPLRHHAESAEGKSGGNDLYLSHKLVAQRIGDHLAGDRRLKAYKDLPKANLAVEWLKLDFVALWIERREGSNLFFIAPVRIFRFRESASQGENFFPAGRAGEIIVEGKAVADIIDRHRDRLVYIESEA